MLQQLCSRNQLNHTNHTALPDTGTAATDIFYSYGVVIANLVKCQFLQSSKVATELQHVWQMCCVCMQQMTAAAVAREKAKLYAEFGRGVGEEGGLADDLAPEEFLELEELRKK